MTRAQGLLKRWQQDKDKASYPHLETFINYQYELYKHQQQLCYMPIKNKAYWLQETF